MRPGRLVATDAGARHLPAAGRGVDSVDAVRLGGAVFRSGIRRLADRTVGSAAVPAVGDRCRVAGPTVTGATAHAGRSTAAVWRAAAGGDELSGGRTLQPGTGAGRRPGADRQSRQRGRDASDLYFILP